MAISFAQLSFPEWYERTLVTPIRFDDAMACLRLNAMALIGTTAGGFLAYELGTNLALARRS